MGIARSLVAPAAIATAVIGTAALSILGYEHNSHEPVIRLWNDNRHVTD